jgi:two-component system, sensor histidine kinase and response regulator
LAITQRLVKLMKGDIKVKSKLDEGSVFTVTIPFKIDNESILKTFNSIKALEGTKILLIDDNETDIRIINHYLSEVNCVIYEAKSCKEATEIINQNNNISVIIVNHTMPLDCDEKLAKLSESDFKDIPIILYSSMTKRGDSIWAKKKEFKGYLTKPIKKNELIETIRMVITKEIDEMPNYKMITKHVLKEKDFQKRIKILIVEDNEINCKLIHKIFERREIYYDFAYNGQDAVDAVKLKDYDLILMDCQMPIMDGYEATAQIRAFEKGLKHTPIIAMTANAMSTDKEKCCEIGMDDYISKPININDLFELIKKHIKREPNPTSKENEIETILDNIFIELGLSKDDALQILKEYTEIAPNTISWLESACEENDIEKMKKLAHKIKGSSANLRIEKMKELSIDLEKAILENLGQDYYRRIITQMKKYIEQLKSLINL